MLGKVSPAKAAMKIAGRSLRRERRLPERAVSQSAPCNVRCWLNVTVGPFGSAPYPAYFRSRARSCAYWQLSSIRFWGGPT